MRFGSLSQWLSHQQRVHPQAIDLTLERVRAVAQRLGLLEPHCPVVTVGGTNGKGSTATTLAALLQACGRHVGLFTSPHLVHYNERIQLDGVPVDDARLMHAFERIEAACGDITLTFFEYNTLAALQIFADSHTDAVVLEVGLGGRLDATNILDADVAVLCSIGFDHRDWLGDTLEAIGAEKAGILRPHRPVVLGSCDMPHSVWQAAATLACPVWSAQREFRWRIHGAGQNAEPWDFEAGECRLQNLPASALPGVIQYGNAAAALTALQLLPIDGGCERQRIAGALRALRLPGRFQIIPGEVEWILDVAHNPPAAQVLAQSLAARAHAGRTLAVAGMLADKEVEAIARELDRVIDHWILVGIQDEARGLSAASLRERLPPMRTAVEILDTVIQGCERARALALPGDRIVILGSFHVVGPALSWLGLY